MALTAVNSCRSLSREAVMVLIYIRAFLGTSGSYTLFRSLRHKFDPLDREILERTFDATVAVWRHRNSAIKPLHSPGAGRGALAKRPMGW